jgi:hypothetical protein
MKHAAAALFTHHWRRSDVVSLTRLEVLQARLFSTRSQITGRSNRMLRKLRNGQRERARGSYATRELLAWGLPVPLPLVRPSVRPSFLGATGVEACMGRH